MLKSQRATIPPKFVIIKPIAIAVARRVCGAALLANQVAKAGPEQLIPLIEKNKLPYWTCGLCEPNHVAQLFFSLCHSKAEGLTEIHRETDHHERGCKQNRGPTEPKPVGKEGCRDSNFGRSATWPESYCYMKYLPTNATA